MEILKNRLWGRNLGKVSSKSGSSYVRKSGIKTRGTGRTCSVGGKEEAMGH
jgi:hypothetical protein